MSWDDFDLSSFLADYDFGDFGGDLIFDTDTGEFVDPSQVNPADVMDMTGSPSGVDPNDPSVSGPVTGAGTSISDQLRSRVADSMTDGTQPYDWTQMADPSASIASAGGSDWTKALAAGLGKALGGLGGGLGSLLGGSGSAGGSAGLSTGAAPMMGASTPNIGAAGEAGGLPGLAGLIRPAMEDPVSAALMRLQADPGGKLALQAPIDAGPAPVKFTPLQMPTPGGGVPMAGQAAPRMGGLQRLMSERLG